MESLVRLGVGVCCGIVCFAVVWVGLYVYNLIKSAKGGL